MNLVSRRYNIFYVTGQWIFIISNSNILKLKISGYNT